MSAVGFSVIWVRTRFVAACFAGGIGSVVLLGWASGHFEFTRILSKFSAMNPVTAVSIVALSIALVPRRRAHATTVRVLASIPIVVGTAKLMQLVFGAQIGIDQLLFKNQLELLINTIPNRMAPNTAVALAMIGISLILSGAISYRLKLVSHVITIAVVGITSFALLGYLLGLTVLYEMPTFNAMAPHSAASLLAIAIGVLSVNPDIGLMRILTDRGPTGALARTTLPVAVVVPVIVSLVRLSAEHAGLYGTNDGLAIQVFVNGLITFTLLMTSFSVILRNDRHRRDRELAIAHRNEQQLLHMARRTAMGDMAAAIAHELNQPLAAISMYLASSKIILNKDAYQGPVLESLNLAKDQCLRAGDIIRRVRNFVAGGDDEKQAGSVTLLVDEACALALLDSHTRSVTTSIEHNGDDIMVLVDKVQIEQVIINLLRNATDAVSHTKGAAIRITTETGTDGMATVSVSDNGPGLSPDIIGHLFEPFVSTKGVQGMGVGLSLCRTIVERHGGKIWADLDVRGGTTFRFTLPSMRSQMAT